jgi:transposase
MLSLPLPVRVYLCLEPTDMRRSFDGLCRMVREHVGADPLSGDLFVFRSKRGDRVKLLYWLGDGLAIWYRRLEEGMFVFPKLAEGSGLSWSRGTLGLRVVCGTGNGQCSGSLSPQKRHSPGHSSAQRPQAWPIAVARGVSRHCAEPAASSDLRRRLRLRPLPGRSARQADGTRATLGSRAR